MKYLDTGAAGFPGGRLLEDVSSPGMIFDIFDNHDRVDVDESIPYPIPNSCIAWTACALTAVSLSRISLQTD